MNEKILALVLAGGEGSRLYPLTAERPKPAVHLANGYCLIDFVLGNLVNSQVPWIYCLLQYRPQQLVRHIASAWMPALRRRASSLHVAVPAGLQIGFKGTADAVRHNLHLIERHRPDLVAVLAADHVYRMDLRHMAAFHRERGAQATIASVPVPLLEASGFGVMGVEANGALREFREKPVAPQPMPGDPARALASMGIYLFEPATLVAMLEPGADECTDFGHHVLPRLLACGTRTFAYDFSTHRVPGLRPWEQPGYWRDVGTLESLAAVRVDVGGPQAKFELENPEWPVRFDLPSPRAASPLPRPPGAERRQRRPLRPAA